MRYRYREAGYALGFGPSTFWTWRCRSAAASRPFVDQHLISVIKYTSLMYVIAYPS